MNTSHNPNTMWGLSSRNGLSCPFFDVEAADTAAQALLEAGLDDPLFLASS
ncbi:hypothetical protein [Paenibacillus borealis]|uniref:hypothetical protein n=1 Tax=Paenibacillus borealis TaxID=160799 RepID=UPI001C54F945|nr:hypothetical protein [Paenibacillus borealis]